jgi:hypothetical protein
MGTVPSRGERRADRRSWMLPNALGHQIQTTEMSGASTAFMPTT